MRVKALAWATLGAVFLSQTSPAFADDLYNGGQFPAFASDIKAGRVGDAVTIVVFETASASNRVTNRTGRSTRMEGGLQAGSVNESGGINFGGSFSGSGEVTRSEQVVASITANVAEIAANGDLILVGNHQMLINGEVRNIGIRGRVRQVDISSQNTVISNRIADAQINFDGKGFVSRSAKPGLLNRIFSFLGIG